VLMTKFGKSGKTGPSSFLFQTIQFWQFQNKIKEEAKLEDLKIQCVLKHEKGLKGIKGPGWKKMMQEVKVAKTGLSGFGYRSILFFQNR
jgi:hypothetical protein